MPDPLLLIRVPLRPLAALAAVLAALALGALVFARVDESRAAATLVPAGEPRGSDPFAFDLARVDEFERRAAFGTSHVLYAKSPGGIVASAARTAAFRPLVERAAAAGGVEPDLLEAIVLLESAGRPDVIAGDDPVSAAGLVQIMAETATTFLGMEVDLAASRRLTRRLATAAPARAEALRAARRRVDARFDPERALAGAVRYLVYARDLLGRDDLAVASYHMGIGNLEGVIRRFVGGGGSLPVRELVERHDLSYARLFFGSSPVRHAAAWRRLNELADDTRNYYWKVLAAREVMRLHRDEPARLAELARLHARKASAEEVLHPGASTHRFRTPAQLDEARREGLIQPLPDAPGLTGFRLNPGMGSLAPRVAEDRTRADYRGLRPEALAFLLELTRQVRALSGDETPLVLTSTVRDDAYQAELVRRNDQATPAYSLHTTGFAFDLARAYGSERQAAAVQFVLERMATLGLCTWVKEPGALHVTVAAEAARLVPRLLVESP